MNALSICSTSIKLQDGLYSLNDLHKAAGGESKFQPSNFMRNEQTLAMVAELNSSDLRSFKITTGSKGGTYVCRELVYAYAMWISAKFSLEVIRAFDTRPSKPKALPKKPEGIPPERQSAINRRAWELAQGTYENFRSQMGRDPMVKGGYTAPDQWEPVECTTDVMESIEATAHAMEVNAYTMRQQGRMLARMVGKNYDHEVARFLSPDEKARRIK